MTTLDSIPPGEISFHGYRSASRRREASPRLPMMAVFHFCLIAGVALFCLNLVH